jgi:hypothetical protein
MMPSLYFLSLLFPLSPALAVKHPLAPLTLSPPFSQSKSQLSPPLRKPPKSSLAHQFLRLYPTPSLVPRKESHARFPSAPDSSLSPLSSLIRQHKSPTPRPSLFACCLESQSGNIFLWVVWALYQPLSRAFCLLALRVDRVPWVTISLHSSLQFV